jgi:hypothetical protein
MRFLIVSAAIVLVAMNPRSEAQHIKDLPWNPEHIDHLPPDVRSAVLAKCSARPNAGHYFATYFHDEINLHYERLHCETTSFCEASVCLHEGYRLTGGHYRLVKSFYGSRSD